MRKITRAAVEALKNRKFLSRDNTTVNQDGDAWVMRLHGTQVAQILSDGEVQVRDGGYRSQTTLDRIRAVAAEYGCSVYQKQYSWYYLPKHESKPLDMPEGQWVTVHEATPMARLARVLAND